MIAHGRSGSRRCRMRRSRMLAAAAGSLLRLGFLETGVSVCRGKEGVEGEGRGTKTVIFAEANETEADREHAGVHEDGDGVVRRLELRGVGSGGETGIDIAQHDGGAERESSHGVGGVGGAEGGREVDGGVVGAKAMMQLVAIRVAWVRVGLPRYNHVVSLVSTAE